MTQATQQTSRDRNPPFLPSAYAFFRPGGVTWRQAMAGSAVLLGGAGALAAAELATLLWSRHRRSG